ncbi:MAG: class I SAM-dependent methyltransferase, partial [Candidatus Sumerlaeia bacterium]|nr:class I SAM-dependent methyltransferase [Candidatus Sumerlaeia bacterium]
MAGESQQASIPAGELSGGFVVRLGCNDADALVALRSSDSYLVQGLDPSGENVRAARQRIRERGLYGPITVREFDGVHLPYQDNMVNLLIADNPYSVSRDEIMRVLCPNG